jgi:hypothetical protein
LELDRRPLPFALLLQLLCVLAATAGRAEPPAPTWVDAALPDPAEPGWGFLWTCDSMSQTQEKLATVRSDHRTVVQSGREARSRCPLGDTRCLAGLAPLRDSSNRLKASEDSLQNLLARLAARCPDPGWRRYQERRAWIGSLQSDRGSEFERTATLASLARSGWKATWISGTGDSLAIHDLDAALAATPTPEPDLLLRKALLVDRYHKGASADSLLAQVCAIDSTTRECKGARLHSALTTSLPPDRRLAFLESARRDPRLAPFAWEFEFQLLDSASRASEATEALRHWLLSEGGHVDTIWLHRLARVSNTAGIPPDTLQRRLGPNVPWADTLFLFQARERIRSGDLTGGMTMLAQFQVRFPRSRIGPWARDWLGMARRKDPRLLAK